MKTSVVIIACLACVLALTPSIAQPAPPEQWSGALPPESVEIRGKYRDVDLSASAISARRVGVAHFDHCTWRGEDLLRDTAFHAVTFTSCELGELGILGQRRSGDRIHDVRIIESQIATLTIEGMDISRLVFKGCHIERLEFRRCTIDTLELIGGKIGEVVVVGCDSARIAVGNGTRLGELRIEGGKTAWLDLGRVSPQETLVALDHVVLQTPYIGKEAAVQIDFSGAIVDPQAFRLWQEQWPHDYGVRGRVALAMWAEASVVYDALRQQSADRGQARRARAMAYRSEVCDWNGQRPGVSRALAYVWGEWVRGKYGTSWQTVVLTGLVAWAAFGVAYALLGWGRYAWALEVPVGHMGESVRGARGRVVIPYGERTIGNYLAIAGVFSLEHLLVIGGRVFQISGVSDLIKPVPKVLVAVGVGRCLALGEALIGLALIVSFVRAFVATLT